MKATLALENGTWYDGESAGAPGQTGGDVVLNTAMTGYPEVLTDPSYSGLIVTMTSPEIGNSGVATDDAEPGTIVEEMQAGYVLKDRLLRPALVAVAKAG